MCGVGGCGVGVGVVSFCEFESFILLIDSIELLYHLVELSEVL